MAAILEELTALLGLLLESLVTLVFLCLELLIPLCLSVIGWLAELCAFLIALLIVGPAVAIEQRRKSRETRLAAMATRKQQWAAARSHRNSGGHSSLLIGSVLCLGFMALIVWGVISHQIHEARIHSTAALLKQCADQQEAVEKQHPGQPRLPALLKSDRRELPVLDAWKQPLELFTDETPAGMLIVIRSRGPDRESGTIDDMLEIRPLAKDPQQLAREVAGGLAGHAKDWIRQKIAGPAR